ncbi:glycosyltransferase family 2 protein [Marinicrinis lubricantis]|uniref:Glucosyl-3-phosphoglycerate synthase n=1 Tax=Marinicrinis lubricantis TaxID=2086470 RepID=A0ABW1ISR9_9BACL
MRPSISIIIPAYNEEHRIGETLQALHRMKTEVDPQAWTEMIVIDDGSNDRTSQVADRWCDLLIRYGKNQGKGAALMEGFLRSSGDIIVFLDADLGESAVHAVHLIRPVMDGLADMTIAKFPPARRKGGFGLVKKLASGGIYRLCGFKSAAPLSGQRAIRKAVLERIGGLSSGFGIEVGLTIDAARSGFRIVEIEVPFKHRESGRDWSGFYHRGKQFLAVGRALLEKWRQRAT